ncbi:MAG: CYTH domain-containing protein [Candidatus Binatia bacterium]|nr:CYTH domain-containing protein [Candidatus Binatia bacterium]
MRTQPIITRMAQPRPIPLEIEAKLLVPHPSTLSTIARLRHIGPYRLRPRRPARLYTIYLDTDDLALARHGIAVRLRRNRTRWEATLKWSGTEEGVIHTRPERTVRLVRKPTFPYTLPLALQSPEVRELVTDTPLHPILLSDVYRRRFTVSRQRDGKARVCAELALDRVRLRHPQARHPTIATYSEVEIELEADGTVEDVQQIAALLQERFALTPATGSKFSRGLHVLYGAERLPTHPFS